MIKVVRKFKFWEMPEATPHEIKLEFDSVWYCYDVMIDDKLHCTVDTEEKAIVEIVKFLDNVWWTAEHPLLPTLYGEE